MFSVIHLSGYQSFPKLDASHALLGAKWPKSFLFFLFSCVYLLGELINTSHYYLICNF